MISSRRVLLCASLLTLVASGARGQAQVQVPLKNHALDIDAAGATICEDGAVFVATVTDTDAIGPLMTSQVFDQLGTTLRGTGGTFTFTSVGEMHTFTVLYPVGTFASGEFIGLSVSDVPGTVIGNVGSFNNTAQVADCLLPMAPATPVWALALLLTAVLAGGFLLLGKAPGVFASTGRGRGAATLVLAVLGAAALIAASPAGAQTIVIVKDSVPSPHPQDFHFSGDLGEFDLDDDTDLALPSSMSFGPLAAGTYTVSEDPVAGWILTDISCADPTENSAIDTVTATATIVLDGTETITCTFFNSQAGKLVVDKVTEPVGDPTSFDFSLGLPETTPFEFFSLTDEDAPYMVFLLPGEYVVSETVPAGWEELSAACDNEDSPGSVFLGPGETVTCVFRNRTTATSDLVFEKSFSPDTIGPGSSATLTFTITNPSGIPAGLLTFSDDLPPAITVAAAPNATSTCGGTVVAPGGGATIEFFGGSVGGFASCTVKVDVTSSVLGTHTNTSNPLTSTKGIAGGPMAPTLASDDLTVDSSLPGFSKSFTPSVVPLGGRSTLVFVIDNTLNFSPVSNLDFTDNLPVGMEIAAPSNAVTDCGTPTIPPTLTAVAGSSLIVLDADGVAAFPAVPAGSLCTVTADVVATGAGSLENVSDVLLASFVAAGSANATLTVTTDPLHLTKEFTDDPVPPGGSVTVEFTLTNFSRDEVATSVAFSDDLTALAPPLAGLTFDSVLANDCGGTVSGAGGGTTVGLSGVTLAAEATCTLRLSLSVPGAATPNTYTNTSSAVTGTVGGEMVTGNTASDDLHVSPVPLLVKEFRDATTGAPDPVVNPGDDVVIRFTVTNTSATSGATDVEFLDELTDGSGGSPPDTTSGFLPFPVTIDLPPDPDPPCGAGSSLALVFVDTDRQALELSGGSLAAADSCTFEVTVEIPADFPPGIYTNTTEEPTATVDGATRTGLPSSDTLTVIGAPTLKKAFIDDPAAPGGTVTLQFTLDYPADQAGDATAITFSDDLSAAGLAGLKAAPGELPLAGACNGTGTLSGSMGDQVLTFMGGTLMPGESCVFSVTLQLPGGADAGSYSNTTSGVGATVGGLAAIAPPASDTLVVSGLEFSKEFLTNPAIAGETVTLRFTIDNVHPTLDATITLFTDFLAADLAGLAATGPATFDDCGGTLGGAPGTFLFYFGGGVLSGETCTIEVPVLVPPATDDGIYTNVTSNLSALQGGAVTADPAVADLTVQSTLLELTKEFTDDPVAPGDPVTLELTLTNLDPDEAASGVAFDDDFSTILPAIAGLTFDSVLFDDCLGTIAGTGTSKIMVTGVSLAAGASCTIRVSLTVSAAADPDVYTNTTDPVSGTIGGLPVSGEAASDELTVVELLLFEKSFDGPTVAGGTPVLTFTITNPRASSAAGLAFSDDLDAVLSGLVATGLPLADVCGSGSEISGTSFLTFTGGSLAGSGGTCTFDVDLAVPPGAAVGTYPNTTSALNQSGLEVSKPATASLEVEPPPTFAKSFAPNPILVGGLSTLTFTIGNSASDVESTDLAFTDSLPAGLEIANPPDSASTCGGMGDATAGATTFSFAGGTVAAGADCTVVFNVTATAVGVFVNTSGDLTSSAGSSGTASDTLTVLALDFSKAFAPDSIGPGSTTELVFTIANTASGVLAEDVAFTDVLPAGVVIATPASAFTDCTDGVLSAPAGGTTIGLAGARLGIGQTCTVTVNVTAAAAGEYDNLSGELTSTVGSGGTAAATLTVDETLPGFSKSFAPGTIPPGGTSTLTFVIDFDPYGGDEGPGAGTRGVSNLPVAFTDPLPTGLVVALPSNAVSDCSFPSVTASPGDDEIIFSGLVTPGVPCTVEVDVTAATAGLYENVSLNLLSGSPVADEPSGFATAELDVFAGFLIKSFTDDPVPPGGTVTLEFTVNNPSRDFMATDIAFSDDLDAVLPGTPDLVAMLPPVPNPPCGPASSLTLAPPNVLTFAGGELPPEGSCTFSVTLAVPVGAATGMHLNTTSPISATIDGVTEVGDPATDVLDVVGFPLLTKEFLDPMTMDPDPVVGAGDDVLLRFTVANTSPTSAATSISFFDEITSFLPFPITVSAVMPLPPCGAGSTFAVGSCGTECEGLQLSGGTLAAAGMAGDSCTFEVTLTLPIGLPQGTYVNTTDEITAMVDGEPVAGFPASDSFDVVAAPRLTKEFLADPVQPGDTVTLRFTLEHDALAAGDATGVSFSDDLAAVLPGVSELTATGLPLTDVCGPGNGTLTGTAGNTALNFSGATLPPGGICSFDVSLSVPSDAPSGTHVNKTSTVVATVLGVATTGNRAEDDLTVGGLVLTKAFIGDPVIAGETVDLVFEMTNLSPNPVTGITFEDPLDPDVLTGLTVVTPMPLIDPCGPGSTLAIFSGGSPTVDEGLRLTGGSLDPAGPVEGSGTCTFMVEVMVPVGTPSDTYVNRTRGFSGTVGEMTVLFPNASDDLEVANGQLALSKEFIDDPVSPGGVATLEFSVITLGTSEEASDLAFTDDLGAALAGLAAVPPFDTGTCGGTLTGTSVLTFSGGALSGGECSFTVDVQVPAGLPVGTTALNVTSEITGTIGGLAVTGPPAEDELLIDLLDFNKSFDGPTFPGGSPVLTFSIENLSATESISGLGFTDDLDATLAGLVASALPLQPCGPGSSLTGTSVLNLVAGNLLPDGSCTFNVTLSVPAITGSGSFLNTTTELTASGLSVAQPATASLIVKPPPIFSKVFNPDVIAQGATTRLTFTIDNTANDVAATGLAFVDVLPFDLLVAMVPGIVNDCGGTVTAPGGGTSIALMGGSVGAGASCTIGIDIAGPTPRTAVNVSGALTSSSGNSGSATDVLGVAMCMLANVDLVLTDPPLFTALTVEACNTVTLRQHFNIFGPDGALTARAGSAVIIENGVVVAPGGELTIELDPALLGTVPPP